MKLTPAWNTVSKTSRRFRSPLSACFFMGAKPDKITGLPAPSSGGGLANPLMKAARKLALPRAKHKLTLPQKARRILYCEALGFLAILTACWLDEWSGFHSWPFKRSTEMNWSALWVQTLIILAVGISALLITRELLGRILYLEGFVRICAWCRKVKHGREWIMLEDYLQRGLDFGTSHGICPKCEERLIADAAKDLGPERN